MNVLKHKLKLLISYIMETIITKQLLAFLETNNLLSDHQYGFRQIRSTGDLLAYSVHVCSTALQLYGESRVISLDISKAFDCVWHKGLLVKLPMFGLHHTLIKWMASSLNLILSTLVYLRALLSRLFYLYSSKMI